MGSGRLNRRGKTWRPELLRHDVVQGLVEVGVDVHLLEHWPSPGLGPGPGLVALGSVMLAGTGTAMMEDGCGDGTVVWVVADGTGPRPDTADDSVGAAGAVGGPAPGNLPTAKLEMPMPTPILKCC